jgi:hypothetical protein
MWKMWSGGNVCISKLNFEMRIFLHFYVLHTKKVLGFRHWALGLAILNKRWLRKSENGKVKCRNRSDLHK